MGIDVGGSKRGIVSEINVVPLIDVLLVLLVIFMIIPHRQTGLRAEIPQPADQQVPPSMSEPDIIVIQVLGGESLKINDQPVTWEALRGRLEEIFKARANRTAFVRGESTVEFQLVAKVIDVMQAAGISSVGLLTPRLEQGH
jgi:biopolymer transport protein ExbD